MSVVITREDIMAYAEVDYIIHHMNEKYVDKVPEKLLKFFATIKDPEYEVYVDPRVPLQNQHLKKYTLELLALLHLKYWCQDEERKKELYQKMIVQQQKLDDQLKEKYNVDNMFDLNSAKVVNSEADLQDKADYSKPRNITKYDVITEQNPEMQDFTDVEEDKLSDYLGVKKVEEIKQNEAKALEKLGFFSNIIAKFKSIFSKSNKAQ